MPITDNYVPHDVIQLYLQSILRREIPETLKTYVPKNVIETYLKDILDNINSISPQIVRSAFNKSFGFGPDTISEGNHTHEDISKTLNQIASAFGLVFDYSTPGRVPVVDITPYPTIIPWTATGCAGEITRSRIYLNTWLKESKYELNLPVDNYKGTKIWLAANVVSPETKVQIFTHSPSGGWEFHVLVNDTTKMMQITIPNDIDNIGIAAIRTSENPEGIIDVRNLKVYTQNTNSFTKTDEIPSISYAIWSWGNEIVNAPGDELEFLLTHRIHTVYQSVNPDTDIDKLAIMVDKLATSNIDVQWLTGDPNWYKPENHEVVLDAIDKVLIYNTTQTQLSRIHVLQLDIEPHGLPEWVTDHDKVVLEFMEMYDTSYEYACSKELAITACIPPWYTTVMYDNKYGKGNLYEFICTHSHGTVLMSYNRKYYLGVLQQALNISYAHKREVASGIDTQDPATTGVPEDETFWNAPISEAYEALYVMTLASQVQGLNKNFKGIIHSYASYKKYCDKPENLLTAIELPVVSIPNTSNDTNQFKLMSSFYTPFIARPNDEPKYYVKNNIMYFTGTFDINTDVTVTSYQISEIYDYNPLIKTRCIINGILKQADNTSIPVEINIQPSGSIYLQANGSLDIKSGSSLAINGSIPLN